MNLSLLAVGTGVITTAVVVSSPRSGPVPSVFEDPDTPTLTASIADVTIGMEPDTTLRAFADLVREQGVNVVADWSLIEDQHIESAEPLGISGDEIPLGFLLDRLTERTDFDWRLEGGKLHFGTQHDFDRRERTLIAYDLRHLAADVTPGEISVLLYKFVEPDQWRPNGGVNATLEFAGGRMFVEAPPRMHRRTQWILDELSDGEADHAGRGRNVEEPEIEVSQHGAGLYRGAVTGGGTARGGGTGGGGGRGVGR